MPATLLLVDDDSEFREELKAYLEEYDVVEASSGTEAVRLLKRPNEIDLVILDVMMPGMNGTEVLREMKRSDPGLGIIILTGHSSKDVAVEALKGRADEYVEKSFDIARIRDVIEKLLDEGAHRLVRKGGSEKSKVERVKAYLARNCYRKVRLADAARAVSLSPKYLSRMFKAHAGMGFAAYRQQIGVSEGKKLLRTGHLSVSEIALRIGYANPESFVRLFKRLTGSPPSHFRGRPSGRKK